MNLIRNNNKKLFKNQLACCSSMDFTLYNKLMMLTRNDTDRTNTNWYHKRTN